MPAAGAAPAAHEFESLSREFALVCDADGVVAWCDERCRRALAIEPGAALTALAAPGTRPKLVALFEQGAAHEVRDWEVSLIVHGVPATIGFSARPHEAGIVLVGRLAPEAYLRAIDQLSDSMQEVLTLNREVVAQKRELQKRHDEALRLHRELSEAHQGVLGMHRELEDRAAQLAEAAELKSRIVANVSHEFRTPLHAIQGLTRLLLDGLDGPLTPEQAKQIGFIRASAEELIQFVDDFLDLSRAEAGKAAVRVEKFELADLVAALRGMLRPLLPRDSEVALVFEEPAAASLETDRTKVAQIVRNLVSNALKFTLHGEVRVTFGVVDGVLEVRVADTGIGIAPEHLDRIFEEFGQVESAPPTRVKGTGLGLSLSRRLAELLGGEIEVESQPGRGSTFTLRVPPQHPEAREMRELVERSRHRAPGAASILVVEDDRKQMFVY
ncbi:MAG TPA: HAMP domain-containing sensor histidine kinase, partial [Usitatibacter sp.]|nr:HAMP domain-containing sensor histidine kinase [Usitatibacter sp.]